MKVKKCTNNFIFIVTVALVTKENFVKNLAPMRLRVFYNVLEIH